MTAGSRPWWRPAPGHPDRPEGRRGFWARLDIARVSVVRAGKQAGATAHRVAVQGMQRAKMSGARLARHVISVQRAAGLNPHLMRESARSVAGKPMQLAGDRAWQLAYTREAERLGALPPAAAMPRPEPAMALPERPSWPNITPSGPDREAG